MNKHEEIFFESVDEAIQALKLDKRHKWEEFNGEIVYSFWYSSTCTGCDGGGCRECGYKGNTRKVVPIPALMPDGSIAKIFQQNTNLKP